MKHTSLPKVIFLDVDNLDYSVSNNAALAASIEEPVNVTGVI